MYIITVLNYYFFMIANDFDPMYYIDLKKDYLNNCYWS